MRYQRLQHALTKNSDEMQALFTGQLPSFVFGSGHVSTSAHVPVFVFHDIHPEAFAAQLQYLHDNGYTTLGADELEAVTAGAHTQARAVVLTFDDATWTLWTYAFPLLKKFGYRAIAFAVAGIVPEERQTYPNLDDVWAHRSTAQTLEQRSQQQVLCTWQELQTMQNSGIVDVQCHSHTHARVPISPQVVDFLHPDFDTAFANVMIPLSSLDRPIRPQRALRLGAPVFTSMPLLACQTWFREASYVTEALTQYVIDRGGPDFFRRPTWRKELLALFHSWPKAKRGDFTPAAFRSAAIKGEIGYARKVLEEHLNKPVRHFCYPWYASSPEADHVAQEAGYRVLYYGPALRRSALSAGARISRIRRLPDDYLFCLPGKGRGTMWSVWRRRLQHFVHPARSM